MYEVKDGFGMHEPVSNNNVVEDRNDGDKVGSIFVLNTLSEVLFIMLLGWLRMAISGL
jgi:hypothetical protein